MNQYDIKKVRADFPQLCREIRGCSLVYLDNAATTLKPLPVIEAMDQFYRHECSNVHRGAHYLSDEATSKFESSREKVKSFINAKETAEVVFVRGTTEGLNLVAHSYARAFLKEGDEIILSEMEHHSNIVPWQLVAEEKGARIKVVPVDDKGELVFDKYLELLSERTKIVSLTHCSNALGTINPLKKYITEAHKVGAITVVDAAQSVSCSKVDVQDLDCDFLAFSGHKLFGPYGIGVLYGKKELLEKMPPYQGGGSMISKVTFEKTDFLPPPQRFEAGTTHISGVIGLGAAIDYFESLSLDHIVEHKQALLSEANRQLSGVDGLRFVGEAENKTGIVSFLLDGIHPSDVGALLDQQGVAVRTGHHCTQPLMDRYGIPGTIRASFSIYNSLEEVATLKDALIKAKELLA